MCYESWSDRQLSNLSPSFPLETGKNFMSTLRLAFQVIEGLTRHLGCLVDDLLFLPVPLDALLMEVVGEKQAIATAQGINLE
jgi:hypothetical protein